MTKRLLIDARQTEETRVITSTNNTIDDFEYEVHSRRQLKGNIYLARVTRVEPSLQAAFVEYGGNRQGFLAFSEIHPDYYRIPVEDRQKLIADVSAKTDEELNMDARMMRLDNEDKKEDAQRRMAWFALFGMLLYPFAVVISMWIGLAEAGKTLGSMAPTYFVSVAAIVAAFYAKNAYQKITEGKEK